MARVRKIFPRQIRERFFPTLLCHEGSQSSSVEREKLLEYGKVLLGQGSESRTQPGKTGEFRFAREGVLGFQQAGEEVALPGISMRLRRL